MSKYTIMDRLMYLPPCACFNSKAKKRIHYWAERVYY